MEIGFFHPSHGYWQAITEPSEDTLAEYPAGTVIVPLKPGPGYTYNGSKWVPPDAEWLYNYAAQEVRAKRDFLLRREVDVVASNALRWASLSAQQQQAWADYRQQLLDVTSQSGFPHNVVWPTKPE